MDINLKQKLDDSYNTRMLLASGNSRFLFAKNGRLAFKKSLLSNEEKIATRALISSLLNRVEVDENSLTKGNIRRFVFDKIFPLHHAICNPSAMQNNEVLKALIEERVERLGPEVAHDPNIIKCLEKIEKQESEIQQVEWKLLNPVLMLKKLWDWPQAKEDRHFLKTQLKVLKWRKSAEERYLSSLTEALLGLKMNLSHETGAEKNGWSGSFFWKSYLNNRKIGVYKPGTQDSVSPGSPRQAARLRYKIIPASHGVLVSQSGKSHIAEAGARIAAEIFHEVYLGLKVDGVPLALEEEDAIVPDTRILEMNFSSGPTEKGMGSFQLFLENCLPLTEAFGINKTTFQPLQGKKSLETENILPHYQWLKLFHYLIFAQDDHADNTMAILNGRGAVVALKAIDNGQSFPAKPLGHDFVERSVLSMKPMCGLNHSLAKNKILPCFKEFLRRFSSEGYLNKLCLELQSLYQDPHNYPTGKAEDPKITAGRIRYLRERFSVLEELFVHQDCSLDTLLHFLKGDATRDKRP